MGGGSARAGTIATYLAAVLLGTVSHAVHGSASADAPALPQVRGSVQS